MIKVPTLQLVIAFSLMMFSLTATKKAVTAFVPHLSGGIQKSVHATPGTPRQFSRLAQAANEYSQATKERLKGLDASQEFSNLATKLKTPEEELCVILTKRLSAMDRTADGGIQKAEYLDWLLSAKGANGKAAKAAPKAKPKSATSNNHEAEAILKETRTVVKKPKKPTVQSTTKNGGGEEQQTFATEVKFADRPDLHPNSKRAIADMGLTAMTEIQDKTFAAGSSGRDVLGRARTGTGKTVAFLLPAIERLLQLDTENNAGQIGILVVSPTRELATQIGDQAEQLTKYHKHMSVQVMFGGTNSDRDLKRMAQRMPTILVATPGRLLDHLQTARIGQQNFGRDIMSQTPLVVLDETDRLLDMGFRREIAKILGYMPSSAKRQTLLFSATIPPDLKVIMAQNMKPDFIEVDCINDGDAATHTNAQVSQTHVIIPSNSDRFVSSVVELVTLAMDKYDSPDSPAKIVVFFPTARLVNFFAEVFNQGNVLAEPVMELHSKKSQSYRNRVSDDFRKAKRGVLFTSDVSARGVDYPNVSHVIQFGMPESRDQYIHRLGRTGRAGTDGKGWLVLSEWESLFLQELKGVDIPVDQELRELMANPISPESKDLVDEIRRRVGAGDQVLSKSAKGAYQAFLGYYLGQMRRMRIRRKEELVDIANDFAELSGLREPPPITKMLIGKMGLKGIAGINISTGDDQSRGGGGRGGGGRGGGRGGGGRGGGHSDGRRAPRDNYGGGRGR